MLPTNEPIQSKQACGSMWQLEGGRTRDAQSWSVAGRIVCNPGLPALSELHKDGCFTILGATVFNNVVPGCGRGYQTGYPRGCRRRHADSWSIYRRHSQAPPTGSKSPQVAVINCYSAPRETRLDGRTGLCIHHPGEVSEKSWVIQSSVANRNDRSALRKHHNMLVADLQCN